MPVRGSFQLLSATDGEIYTLRVGWCGRNLQSARSRLPSASRFPWGGPGVKAGQWHAKAVACEDSGRTSGRRPRGLGFGTDWGEIREIKRNKGVRNEWHCSRYDFLQGLQLRQLVHPGRIDCPQGIELSQINTLDAYPVSRLRQRHTLSGRPVYVHLNGLANVSLKYAINARILSRRSLIDVKFPRLINRAAPRC